MSEASLNPCSSTAPIQRVTIKCSSSCNAFLYVFHILATWQEIFSSQSVFSIKNLLHDDFWFDNYSSHPSGSNNFEITESTCLFVGVPLNFLDSIDLKLKRLLRGSNTVQLFLRAHLPRYLMQYWLIPRFTGSMLSSTCWLLLAHLPSLNPPFWSSSEICRCIKMTPFVESVPVNRSST